MSSWPLIAVVIITNGQSPNFIHVHRQWISEGFSPGRTLFFCGPRRRLLNQGAEDAAIVDYIDPPYYRNNFHINDKKRVACEAVNAKYIYLVHDRLIPKNGFRSTLNSVLSCETIDYGAADVDNEDGTPALREIRLRLNSISMDLESALELVGRLTCLANDSQASENVALNGGQFFLRKSLSHLLVRPLRWMEMEDDVLSHDLRTKQGIWLKECSLITSMPRLAPDFNFTLRKRFVYSVYRGICNILAVLAGGVSVGRHLDRPALLKSLGGTLILIDPLHKIASSDFLPSSLEKLMTRARIASNGKAWHKVEEIRLGWKLTGYRLESL